MSDVLVFLDHNHINADFLNFYLFDFCTNCLHHGVDWIYVSFYNLSIFDFKVFYLWFFNSILDDSFDFFFFFFWYFSLLKSSYQLFFSFFLDYYINIFLFKLPFFDSWQRFIFSSSEPSLLFIYHPEILFIKTNLYSSYIHIYSDFIHTVYNYLHGEVFFSPIILLVQFFFILFLLAIFLSFYFSNYFTYFKDETTIDTDYLLSGAFLEAEKEISSFDDVLLLVVIIIFLFGWYFYIHVSTMFTILPELLLVFYFLPILYFIIFGIPTFLIYDFGIFFLVYLRGVGSSSNIISELMFDYIAVLIFYTRILVQGIRLVLMLFTYLSMNDFVLYFSFNQSLFLGSESFWDEMLNINMTFDSISYFFLFSLPGRLLYWIYEILHTYFVVTVQFIAFFAIVFWLFMFLYTFFVLEKQENYFFEKRQKRRDYYYYLKQLK